MLSLFGLIFPYIYLCALFILPFTYARHKLTFIVGVFLLCFGMKSFLSYLKPGVKSQHKTDDLHVLSFNAMMGFKMVDEHHQFKASNQEALDDLLRQSPDPAVVCIQEASDMVRNALKTTFKDYHVHHINKRGAIILSKYQLLDQGEIYFGSKLNSCLWADILVTPEDTIRVYSAHLESNRLSRSSYDFLTKEEYEPQDAIAGVKDLFVKYPQYAQKRGEQALKVKEHMDKSPYPLILCGDLNDPPMSFTYRTMKQGLNDTFLDNGAGFGTTWNGAIPMLRIDYIFASKELKNTGFQKRKNQLSDHYPVVASFEL